MINCPRENVNPLHPLAKHNTIIGGESKSFAMIPQERNLLKLQKTPPHWLPHKGNATARVFIAPELQPDFVWAAA